MLGDIDGVVLGLTLGKRLGFAEGVSLARLGAMLGL
jgi:hypothetical protein